MKNVEKYECRKAQGGFAAGSVFLLRTGYEEHSLRSEKAEEERLEEAVETLIQRLSFRRERSERVAAELIDAEIMILKDEFFIGYAKTLIREEGLSAAEAVKKAGTEACEKLCESDDEMLRERSADVRGLAETLHSLLSGREVLLPETPCILVGESISPGSVLMTEPGRILGILTETGSRTSHLSILAEHYGVPYLYGLEDLTKKIGDGDFLILDGEEGIVTVNPDESAREEALRHRKAPQKKAPEKTGIKVYANIAGTKELDAVLKAGARGIGLVRSEFLFFNRPKAPTEEEQVAAYQEIVSAMEPKEAVIRLLDIGPDKHPVWLPMKDEANPAMGLRGIRVLLTNKDLLRTQLKALLRAAVAGNLKILIPMVTSLWELDETKKEIETAAAELSARGIPFRIPELGVMIETPAAVMLAPELAEKAAFFSIGTNDLTQFTLAVDRETEDTDPAYDPCHEAVFKMIALTVNAAHAAGIPVTVCGELAVIPEAAGRLIALGVDALSVPVGRI